MYFCTVSSFRSEPLNELCSFSKDAIINGFLSEECMGRLNFDRKGVGIYALKVTKEKLKLAVVAKHKSHFKVHKSFIDGYCEDCGWEGQIDWETENEITVGHFIDLIRYSHHYDIREVCVDLDISELESIRGKEQIIPLETISKEKALKLSEKLHCSDTLAPEIERIFIHKECGKYRLPANPVQYQVCIDDPDLRAQVTDLLLKCLFSSGRIRCSRVYTPDTSPCYRTVQTERLNELKTMYQLQESGAIIMPLSFLEEKRGTDKELDTKEVFKYMHMYKDVVLTIMESGARPPQLSPDMDAYLQSIPVVKICVNEYNMAEAQALLAKFARRCGIKRSPSSMKNIVPDPEGSYTHGEIIAMFNRWYNRYLCNNVYTEYKEFGAKLRTKRAAVKQAVPQKGTAYQELMDLIGLAGVKEIVKQILEAKVAEGLMEKQGIRIEKSSMHMVFTGNPGTAKTTTARLLARIFKDYGILSKGELVEVGRGDLVAKYVGHTALQVKKAFEKAKGSVLFIDEAYSLLDDRRGLFGDEAINTIVQEMENHREDTIVILAGYPAEMEQLISRNPGLRSRISLVIPFADYSAEELLAILEQKVQQTNMFIDPEANGLLLEKFGQSLKGRECGNGRLARNVFEQAKMRHASRIVKEGIRDKKSICTLNYEDFLVPAFAAIGTTAKNIGFCV